jgi:putative 4-hydroxybenzoate polyprenyltransferase
MKRSNSRNEAKVKAVGRHSLVNYALCLGILILFWKITASIVRSPFLLPPETVLQTFAGACMTTHFWQNFLISAYRVVTGMVLAWLLAFPTGILLGYGTHLDNVVAPLVFMTYPVPKIVLLPLVLLMFGLGDLSKIILITSILFFQILVPTRDGVKAIDEKHYDAIRSLGGNDVVILREVVIPAALPHSFTALRIGLGTAISVLFFIESFATTSGLGYLIMDAWARMDYSQLFVGIVGMSLLGICLYEICNLLERRLCTWRFSGAAKKAEGSAFFEYFRWFGARTAAYASLIKFEHTVFALPFALAALLLAHREAPVTFNLVFFTILAMVGGRSAAMGFNRLVDAAIDAKNPRTAQRALATGEMGRGETRIFITASSILFVLSAFFISFTCFWCSIIVLGLLFGYSYTKRFTWLSHLVLGLVIGLIPLAVWVAVTGRLSWRGAALSLALFTYIAGFDILYSCQDVAFDRREGLYSMPVRFGVPTAMHISEFLHGVTFAALVSLFRLFSLTWLFLGFVCVIGCLLIVEHVLVRPYNLEKIDIAFYHINSVISVLVFVALVTDELARWPV